MVAIAKPAETEIAALVDITRREVSLYAAPSDTAVLYPLIDDVHRHYAVLVVNNERPPHAKSTGIVVMARVVGEYVVIEEDRTDKPLHEALMVNGGVPREKIILAYKGEKLPDNPT